MSQLLQLVEITHPTIQGEGQLIGTPAIFVRAYGCDYSCKGCDTPYAKGFSFYRVYTADEVLDRIVEVTKGQQLLVVLTGGNPALQDFSELLVLLAGRGYPTAIETQGSVAPAWLSDVDYMTVSPKAPSTGNVTQIGNVISCIDTFGKHRSHSICIKVVVADHADLNYAKQMFERLSDHYADAGFTYCVQPFNSEVNPSFETLRRAFMELAIEVFKLGMLHVKILPQLHVWLFGNKRGV